MLQKNKFKIVKKGDFIILILILIFSLLPIWFMGNDLKNNSANNIIVIKQSNKEIGRYKLNPSSKSKFIDFNFEVDGVKYKGTIETKNNMVRLCRLPKKAVPKSIHTDMSWIKDDRKIIVALPASLIVQIESDNLNIDSEVDAIVN